MHVQLKESIKMNSSILPRRAFLKGLVGLSAAPAIVRAASLMPVQPWVERVICPTYWWESLPPGSWWRRENDCMLVYVPRGEPHRIRFGL
jgi:hypothetical protein